MVAQEKTWKKNNNGNDGDADHSDDQEGQS